MQFTSDEIKFLRQKHNKKDSKQFYEEISNLSRLIKDNHKLLKQQFKDEEHLKKYADKIFKDNFKTLD